MESINVTLDVFILKGFPGDYMFQCFLFTTLVLVYVVTIVGNILIILIICADARLHSPMYFFLVCLSFMEMTGLSPIMCKLFDIIIRGVHTISKSGCLMQSYLYFFLSSSDFLLLSVMSIDRFVAICYPLRYSSIMSHTVCIKLIVSCFFTSFVCLLYPIVMLSRLHFCGHVINHFFCDSDAMQKLACTEISFMKLYTIISSVVVLIGPLMITAISYIFIVSTVIRLRSDKGRQKNFSTCVSHLTMVSIAFGSAIFIEIRPSRNYSIERDKVVNLVSTVLCPMLNPFIYTLRNQKVKDCLRDKVKWIRQI